MIIGNTRKCDICGEEIPAGTTYRVNKMSPETAALMLDITDPDCMPTWTQEPDGTVRMDICLDCDLGMDENEWEDPS
jgi:hypothetical protein